MTVADIHQVEPVIDHVLTDEGRNAPYVFQCFDVLRHKSDFLEPSGIKGIPSVNMPKDCAKFLELQLSESIFRVMLGQQQLTETTQDILSIQDIVNDGKYDPSDQELIHLFNKAHPRTLLQCHFSKERN